MYSRPQLGHELKEQLNQSYDRLQIARWAESIYVNYSDELTPELYDIVNALSLMELGKQFEFTKQQLSQLAKKLINDEENSLKQIRNYKNDE